MIKNKGYLKHTMSWACIFCLYYVIKEKITGVNYNLNEAQTRKQE